MEFEAQPIPGMWVIRNSVFHDLRGSFSEFWNSRSLPKNAPPFVPQSAATSFNAEPHTLRGLHYQNGPLSQTKLVTCSHGAAFDVVVDLRPESPAYQQWQSVELSPGLGTSILIPQGCAHGFVTRVADTLITYLIAGPYAPEASRVARWNDPLFGITWPVNEPILSERDRTAADFIQ